MSMKSGIAARLAICVGLGLLLVSCRTAPVLTPDFALPAASSARSDAQVAAVIKQVAEQRGWKVEDAGPGHLTGTLNLRKHVAVIDIAYSAKSVRIAYKDSSNLRYANGKIHRNYNNWVKGLADGIKKQLAAGS